MWGTSVVPRCGHPERWAQGHSRVLGACGRRAALGAEGHRLVGASEGRAAALGGRRWEADSRVAARR